MITLLLCASGMLDEPILYLSLYLKQNRCTYYELLQEVRTNGTWETWLEFFLIGVHASAKQAINTAKQINSLFEQDLQKIAKLGRVRFSCEQALEYMKRLPQVTVPLLAKELGITAPTARNALNHMTSIGVLYEISGKKRDKVYLYRNYLDILEEGTEPFDNDRNRPSVPKTRKIPGNGN
jgi:Fic family protein